jgi:hypothetical protein
LSSPSNASLLTVNFMLMAPWRFFGPRDYNKSRPAGVSDLALLRLLIFHMNRQ